MGQKPIKKNEYEAKTPLCELYFVQFYFVADTET
jgi:hypothetical protein